MRAAKLASDISRLLGHKFGVTVILLAVEFACIVSSTLPLFKLLMSVSSARYQIWHATSGALYWF